MTITESTITASLAGLVEPAPEHVTTGILLAVGMADRVATIAGPLGPVRVFFTDAGVSGLVPEDRFDEYVARRSTRPHVVVDALPRALAGKVRKALDTGRLGALPVDLSGLSEFQQAVLRKTAEIPPGELRPYGWVAREIGKPGSTRAVGTALNRNPVPILIPCHRVNRGDGSIGQYGFGTEMKRELLAHEGLDPDELEADAERGVRLTGSDTTSIYCWPTCRHAKRTTARHRVEFRSERQAVAAGYRACLVCRPPAPAESAAAVG
jgi:O-6-methylguanine DNA methyltransferase